MHVLIVKHVSALLQCLTLLEGLIIKSNATPNFLGKIYVFTIMWSIGALLELQDRDRLAEFLYSNLNEWNLDLPVKSLGSAGTIFDYFVNSEGNGWKSLSKNVFLIFWFMIRITRLPDLCSGIQSKDFFCYHEITAH